jgi:phospholipid-binding lipoprotein MlaA
LIRQHGTPHNRALYPQLKTKEPDVFQPRTLLLLLISLLGSGCATVQAPDERDPWEGFNRAAYAFNDDLDRTILKPLAKGYQKVVPEPINNSVTNFFSNLDDVVVLANDLLQFKFEQSLSDLSRITVNTLVGIGGLFDVASHMDLPKHNEDFGQTLGYWGVGSGPYLVIPFLGPSTVRDGLALPVDWQLDPLAQVEDNNTYWGAIALRTVDSRAGLLRASRILDTAALDPYTFMRDAYLQRRQNLVYDGNPPKSAIDEFDPFSEEFDPLAEPSAPPAGDAAP